MIRGEYKLAESPVIANEGRREIELEIANTGDRPIQVGSHFHFFEVNRALAFDRAAAYGMRLDIPAGTAVRFEPGEIKTVCVIALAGSRELYGGSGLVHGDLDDKKNRAASFPRLEQVQKSEVQCGGGKVIRSSQGQSPFPGKPKDAPLDLVITTAVVLDHWGIVKGDIGIRNGRIVGVGKAGNPLIQPGVDPKLVIGPGTEVIAGENLIVTAGGIDTHVHFICPQLVETALASGLTTLLGGGTGPATGTNATTCTPGAWNLQRMLHAAQAVPINLGFLGKGNGR